MTVVSGLFAVTAANAEQAPAPSSALTEVVVTARGRPEKLMSAPLSVQAFSATQIQANKIVNLNDLQFEAGFTFQGAASTTAGGRQYPSLIFRGMQTTYGAGVGDSGSLFVDGVYISGGTASITTADVEQIEVLKGPQNVYFGKNTFGGAVNFITSNPKDEFGGSVQASGSLLGSSDDVVMVQGPLVKSVLDARLTVEDYIKGAQYHTSDGGALGAENTKSITGSFYFTPTSNLWIKGRAHYQQDDDSAADTGYLPGTVYGSLCPSGTGRATTASGADYPFTIQSPYFCGSIPSLGRVGGSVLDVNTVMPLAFQQALNNNYFPGGGPTSSPLLQEVPKLNHSGLRRDLAEFSLQGGYDLPFKSKLQLSMGYNMSSSLDAWDLDRGPNQLYYNAVPISSDNFNIDGRFVSDQSARVRFLIGANYFQSHYESTQYDDNFYGPASQTGYLAPYYTGPTIQSANFVDEDDKTTAVYGSLEADLLSFLTATVELRYQTDTLTDYTGISAPAKLSESFNDFLPRYILKLHPNKDWNFYVSYSEGVQPAVLNTAYAEASPIGQAYIKTVYPGANDYAPAAHLHAWEIGAKQSLFDDRVRYGIAVYYDKWLNQETSTAIFDANPICTQTGSLGGTEQCPLPYYGSSVYEANQATIYGVEFQASALITPKWSVDMAVNYTHATWDHYQNNTYATFTGGAAYYDGNTISRVPEWQGYVDSTYRDHLVADWDWYVHGVVNFTGSMYESEIDLAKTNPYARVNASVGVTKGSLTLELYANNLLNDKNWDWASRVPELENYYSNYSLQQGVLVQAPDRQDFGLKLTDKF